MILHLITSYENAHSLHEYLKIINQNDALLFLEEGVLFLHNESEFKDILNQLSLKHKIYALQEAIKATNLEQGVLPVVEIINYAKFVNLVTYYDKTVTGI
ncbi:MAG: DsrH like protein [Francisellaceae bacterium]|nr:DsrH like protein [Francisellaceae bacterium]